MAVLPQPPSTELVADDVSSPLEPPVSTRTLLAPGRLVTLFSLATFALFLFGPWDFAEARDPRLIVAVCIFNAAIFLGFRTGALSRTRGRAPTRRVTTHTLNTLLNVSMGFTLITLVPRIAIATQNYGLVPAVFVDKITTGLAEAQMTYSERFVAQPEGVWLLINYGLVLTGFISWLYPPLAILLWHRIGWIRRGFTVVACLSAIAISVSRGQNFGAFDVLIQLATFGLIRNTMNRTGTRRTRLPELVRACAVLAVIVVAMSSFFANTMRSRVGDRYGTLLYVGGEWVPINETGILWTLTPAPLQPLLASLSGYITHGYAALGMALNLPFGSTYGLGSSYFLLTNSQALVGYDLFYSTYQYKLSTAENYDSHILWHTAYLWIANDVSFWGVPLILFALFFLFGKAWRDFLLCGNLIAGLLMAPMAIFTAFISANNQLTGQPNALFGFLFLCMAWLLVSRRYAWDRNLLRSGPRGRRQREGA